MTGRLAPTWRLDAGLVAVAAALWVAALGWLGHSTIVSTPAQWWGLVGVFALAGAYGVQLRVLREEHTVSLGAVGLTLGLYQLTAAGLLLASLGGAAAALVIVRRARAERIVFELGRLALSTVVALLVFRALVGLGDPFRPAGWAGAMLGAAAGAFAGLVPVAIAAGAVEAGIRRLTVPAAVAVASSAVVANLVLIVITLVRAEPLALLLLVIPAVVTVAGFRAYVVQARRQEHLEFLYESMKATQGASEFTLAVNQLLMAVRRLVGGEYAEIFLFPAYGQPGLRSSVGPRGASTAPVDAAEPDDVYVRAAMEEVGGALLLPLARAPQPLDGYLRARGLSDGMIAPLRGEEGTFGILLVGDRPRESSSFSADDRRLLETFVGHASVMLENGRLERSLAEVTDLKERLRHQAFHDALTGLPNRALFTERVEEALLRGSGEAAVLFLDLDDFKAINDTLGHGVGDEVLAEIGHRVARSVRSGDTAARLGGDEFAVLLESTDELGSEVVAETLLRAMRRPFQLPSRAAAINASIGIAPAASAASADELLRNADVAMYAAKESGKHRFAHYDPSMHANVRLRHEFALGLRKALERDEIGVAFEPIVDLRHDRIVAFEALARWYSPERGVVMPVDFLPVAEEIGVMGQVGERVLKLACREARTWQETYPGFRHVGVSVNLSPSELDAESLAKGVARALFESRLSPEHLSLEITESDVAGDLESAHLRMAELRALGVKLVLDDFGTGRSSLDRLATFPLDTLKIAKPFVDRLLDASGESGFIDTFVQLTTSLGIECIAEGVEHQSQVARLLERGCTLGQGYHFATPMRPDELGHYLSALTAPAALASAV